TPCGTAAARRANHSRERGPGISVTTLRSCGMSTIGPSSHVLSRPALLRVRAARAGTPVRVSRGGRRAVRPSRDQALERRLYAPASVPPTVPERRAGLYHPYNAWGAAHRQ